MCLLLLNALPIRLAVYSLRESDMVKTREQNTLQLKFKKENIHTIFSVNHSKNNMKLISCYIDLKRFQFLIEHLYQPGNEIQK